MLAARRPTTGQRGKRESLVIRLLRSRLALSLASALLLVTLGGGVTLGASRAASSNVSPHTHPATSCQGFEACDGVTGTIGSNACNGYRACVDARGNVGNGSCHGPYACESTFRNVAHHSCN